MSRFTYILCTLALCLASCTPVAYDDSGVTDRLDEMEQRIEELEKQYGKAQEDIEALRAIIDVLQSRDYRIPNFCQRVLGFDSYLSRALDISSRPFSIISAARA